VFLARQAVLSLFLLLKMYRLVAKKHLFETVIWLTLLHLKTLKQSQDYMFHLSVNDISNIVHITFKKISFIETLIWGKLGII